MPSLTWENRKMTQLDMDFVSLERNVLLGRVTPLHAERARAFLVHANQSDLITSAPALLSVQKLTSIDAMWKRAQEYGAGCYMQPKYDGVSVQAVYYYTGQTHRLLFCGTRRGKDCHKQMARLIPIEIDHLASIMGCREFVVLRGEVVLKDKTTFPGFVSPRTAATSYINTKNNIKNSDRYTVKWFDQYEVDTGLNAVKRDLGEDDIPTHLCNSRDDISGFLTTVKHLPEFCDGIVLKAKDIDGYGSTEHHPRWSAAFKYPSATAESVVTKIYTTIGETGRITPIVEFEPVVISGTTVAKASAGSVDTLHKKGISVGSRVLVELAGQTIPHIKKVIK